MLVVVKLDDGCFVLVGGVSGVLMELVGGVLVAVFREFGVVLSWSWRWSEVSVRDGAGGSVSGGVAELRVSDIMINSVVVVEVVGGGGSGMVGASLDVIMWVRLSCKKRMTALFEGRGGGV